MSNIYKITQSISKIFGILSMVGAVATLIIGIIILVTDSASIVKDMNLVYNNVSVVGMAMYCNMPAEDATKVAGVFLIGSSILLGLLMMIFRNVNLIVRTAEGKTWFSTGMTPFQDDIVRMVREIGIFSIMISIVSMAVINILGFMSENVETSANLLPIVFGIIIICLSKIFEYGSDLQKDEDGLI